MKRQIGVVPEGMALFGRLTGAEFLSFAGRMYGLDRQTAAQRAAELLDFMQLADQPKKLVTDYSHGMQKKLALAAAVIHGPKVLFLDEPFEGVDAIAAGTLKSMLQGMIARGRHNFPRLRMCSKSSSACAATSPSFIRDVWSRRDRWKNCAPESRRKLPPDPSDDGSFSGEKLTLEQTFPAHRRRSAPHRAGAFVAGLSDWA